MKHVRRHHRRRNPLTLSASEVRRHVRRANPLPRRMPWLVLAGIAAVGGVAYYLSNKSTTTTPQPNAPIANLLQIQPGHTYSFTGPLPPQMDATAAVTGLKPVLEALGWTNVSVTSITPGTYSATATYNGPSAFALPPGVTATMVS